MRFVPVKTKPFPDVCDGGEANSVLPLILHRLNLIHLALYLAGQEAFIALGYGEMKALY